MTPHQIMEQWERKYSDAVRYYFIKLHLCQLADDLVQEVFLRSWQQLITNRPPKYPRAWLLAVAHNLAVDVFESQDTVRARLGARIDLDQFDLADDADEPQRLDPDEIENIRTEMMQLPPWEAEVVQRKVLQGQTYVEMAPELGCCPKTCKRHFDRACKRLRKKLQAAQ